MLSAILALDLAGAKRFRLRNGGGQIHFKIKVDLLLLQTRFFRPNRRYDVIVRLHKQKRGASPYYPARRRRSTSFSPSGDKNLFEVIPIF